MKNSYREGKIKGVKESELFYRIWGTEKEKKEGFFVVVHGLGEHSGRYENFAKYFNDKGFDVAAFDLPGHGKSEGRRGDIEEFRDYVDDVDQFWGFIADNRKDIPGFLIGHSMGGLIVLNYGLTYSTPNLKGIISSGPLLGLAVKVPKWKISLGKIALKIFPTLSMDNGINPEYLSRDKKVVEAYINDPLVHSKVTARWFFSVMEAMEYTINHAHNHIYPVLVMHGGEDKLTSPLASEEFVRKCIVKKKKFIKYPNLYHEIFNELEKEIVFSDILGWIEDLKK